MLRSEFIAGDRVGSASLGNLISMRCSPFFVRTRRMATLVVFGGSLWVTSALSAQTLPSATSSQSTADPGTAERLPPLSTGTDRETDPLAERDELASNRSSRPTVALPADQIITVLEQNPDVASELKNQLADRLRVQGIDVEAGDVSDECSIARSQPMPICGRVLQRFCAFAAISRTMICWRPVWVSGSAIKMVLTLAAALEPVVLENVEIVI